MTAKKSAPAKAAAPADLTVMPAWAPRFFETFVTTADVVKALEDVDVPMHAFHVWKADCRPFAEELKVMTRRATETLKLRALSMGLSGSDKMMAIFLKTLEAEEPDELSKLTDEQLDRRIVNLLNRARERAIALGTIPADPTPGESPP